MHSPDSAGALLLARSFDLVVEITCDVDSCFLSEGLQRHIHLELLVKCVWNQQAERIGSYLRKMSDDSVPTDRRKNTHAGYSDRHGA